MDQAVNIFKKQSLKAVESEFLQKTSSVSNALKSRD